MDDKIRASEESLPNQDSSLNFFKAILAGMVTATAFGLGGFFLIRDTSGAMGSVLFVLLPLVTGIATGLIARGKRLIIASLVIGALICTIFLLITGFEGFVCVLMSSPLLAIGLTVGAIVGAFIRRHLIEKSNRPTSLNILSLLLLSFFLMGANSAETKTRQTPREESVTHSLLVDAAPDRVWNQLRNLDKISSSKGFLMRIGLPVPVSCEMEGTGVGAKRTCYFEKGHIEERVTEWNPPHSMQFDVVDFDVPGRPWLSFKDAGYSITVENGHTRITRTTTIVSRLSPAWYWRSLEKIGVETEHLYLFEELKRRLDGAK